MLKYLYLFSFFLLALPVLSQEFSEKVYLSPDDALRTVFQTADLISSSNLVLSPSSNEQLESAMGMHLKTRTYTVYKGYEKDTFLGYALILDELGKYYPITLIVFIRPDFSIGQVRIMVYREHIGSSVRKSRFLKQFKGKDSQSELAIDRDIDGISGATVSSWAVATAVKKALYLTHYSQHEKMAPH